MARDDFSEKTKQTLRRRVSDKCSRCGVLTEGPSQQNDKYCSIGEAAHIEGAAPNSPRYNKNMSSLQRKHIDNAIWLCSNCHTRIDSDPEYFSSGLLRGLKLKAENEARENQGRAIDTYGISRLPKIKNLFENKQFLGAVTKFQDSIDIHEDEDIFYYVLSVMSVKRIVDLKDREVEFLYTQLDLIKDGKFSKLSLFLWLLLHYENREKYLVGRKLDKEESTYQREAFEEVLSDSDKELFSNMKLVTKKGKHLIR